MTENNKELPFADYFLTHYGECVKEKPPCECHKNDWELAKLCPNFKSFGARSFEDLMKRMEDNRK